MPDKSKSLKNQNQKADPNQDLGLQNNVELNKNKFHLNNNNNHQKKNKKNHLNNKTQKLKNNLKNKVPYMI